MDQFTIDSMFVSRANMSRSTPILGKFATPMIKGTNITQSLFHAGLWKYGIKINTEVVILWNPKLMESHYYLIVKRLRNEGKSMKKSVVVKNLKAEFIGNLKVGAQVAVPSECEINENKISMSYHKAVKAHDMKVKTEKVILIHPKTMETNYWVLITRVK